MYAPALATYGPTIGTAGTPYVWYTGSDPTCEDGNVYGPTTANGVADPGTLTQVTWAIVHTPVSPGIYLTPSPPSSYPTGAVTENSAIFGGDDPTGTMTFYDYTGNSCSTGKTQVGSTFMVSGNGYYGPSASVTYSVPGGPYSWDVEYSSGDSKNGGGYSGCQSFTIT